MDKNLYTNKELLDMFTDLTNRKPFQELLLFDLMGCDLNKLARLEEKIHRNFLSYCPGNLEECEKILAMGFKYDGLKDFGVFKDM